MKILRYLKLFLFKIVAGIQHAFDFKHNRRIAILNTVILSAIGISLISFLGQGYHNRQASKQIFQNQLQISGLSSIEQKGQKNYQKYTIQARDPNLSSQKRSNARYQQGLIEGADTTSFEVVSPGQYQLNKLQCLCNQNESYNQKKDILNEYCMFSAGETIWLFQNWIQNIVGIKDINDMKTGFDVNDSILYINKINLSNEQQAYLQKMLMLLWNHSELSVRSHPLQIIFV